MTHKTNALSFTSRFMYSVEEISVQQYLQALQNYHYMQQQKLMQGNKEEPVLSQNGTELEQV